MLSAATGILEVVKGLFTLSDGFRKASQDKRANMAALFVAISDCLAATSAEMRSGKIPHGRCGELMTYAQALPRTLEGSIPSERAQALGRQLEMAHSVEMLAVEIEKAPDREGYLSQLEEASGKFRALSNLVRVGG